MNTLESLDRRDTTITTTAPAEANTPAAALPRLSAAAMRRSLRDKGVQVISIGAIPEQMLFDVRWFVVEAGKPVEVMLTNPDAMPHNLVIGQPGSVSAIGTAAATMPAPTDLSGRAYVPDSPLVLHATRLLQRDESDTIQFTAPAKPGEYNFVCSFPGHWVRMYGVMLVVPSLDAFEAEPTAPNDPLTGKPYDSQGIQLP
jgi:azurin